jgi:hypothetical protein
MFRIISQITSKIRQSESSFSETKTVYGKNLRDSNNGDNCHFDFYNRLYHCQYEKTGTFCKKCPQNDKLLNHQNFKYGDYYQPPQ